MLYISRRVLSDAAGTRQASAQRRLTSGSASSWARLGGGADSKCTGLERAGGSGRGWKQTEELERGASGAGWRSVSATGLITEEPPRRGRQRANLITAAHKKKSSPLAVSDQRLNMRT